MWRNLNPQPPRREGRLPGPCPGVQGPERNGRRGRVSEDSVKPAPVLPHGGSRRGVARPPSPPRSVVDSAERVHLCPDARVSPREHGVTGRRHRRTAARRSRRSEQPLCPPANPVAASRNLRASFRWARWGKDVCAPVCRWAAVPPALGSRLPTRLPPCRAGPALKHQRASLSTSDSGGRHACTASVGSAGAFRGRRCPHGLRAAAARVSEQNRATWGFAEAPPRARGGGTPAGGAIHGRWLLPSLCPLCCP